MPRPSLIAGLTACLLLSVSLFACEDEPATSRDPTTTGDTRPDQIPGDVLDVLADVPLVDTTPEVSPDTSPDTSPDIWTPPPEGDGWPIRVLLDGEPLAGVLVVQGGHRSEWWTDEEGWVLVEPNFEVDGDIIIMASHPKARIKNVRLSEAEQAEQPPKTISLTSMGEDNPRYRFQDPGTPSRRSNTGQCGHCHQSFNDTWFVSPHRGSASNPVLQDLYAGVASAIPIADCEAAGGQVGLGRTPGDTNSKQERCYIGAGVLPAANLGCEEGAPCDASNFGGCANCHAPAINGILGGRDLLEAEGIGFEEGVSCDVCHRVEDVVPEALERGVAGALKLHRPGEASPSITLGTYLPLTFGPSHDSPNPRMGNIQRDHFRKATLCAGCHQLDQPALSADLTPDASRWPDGLLPAQSTYKEWLAGPMNPAAPCQSCHMPPDPMMYNGGDLQLYPNATRGIQGGWLRPPGTSRQHVWSGPRTPESQMLQLAASLSIKNEVVGGTLSARVTVKNVGPGHALPTGDPMRSILLRVEATCDGALLDPTGGDVIPDFGGWLDRKEAGEDWARWPGAQPGDHIRVVNLSGVFHDYEGFGRFGDGSFTPEERGLPVEEYVDTVKVLTVASDGLVTFDTPLPVGDIAYRTHSNDWPVEGEEATALAGAPGFGFARVMTAPDGRRMVPHFAANDIASDNRLMPQKSWTSTHLFDSPCANPSVRAVLLYRTYPFDLARERRWPLNEVFMRSSER